MTRTYLIATLTLLTACMSPVETSDCDGTIYEDTVARYCALGVIAGGFTCPTEFPVALDVQPADEVAHLCADSEDATDRPIPDEVCRELGGQAGCVATMPESVCCPIDRIPCDPDLPLGGSASSLSACGAPSDWFDGIHRLAIDENGCAAWLPGTSERRGPTYVCGGPALSHWRSLPTLQAQNAYCAGAPAGSLETDVIAAIRPADGTQSQVFVDTFGMPALHLELDLEPTITSRCHRVQIDVAFDGDPTTTGVEASFALDPDPLDHTLAINIPLGYQETDHDGETATLTITVITPTGDYETLNQSVTIREQPL